MGNLSCSSSAGNAALPGAWSHFDRAYCISLSKRTDRRERASIEFAQVGLDGRVQFWIVEKHPHDSEQGIFESHLSCLREGIASGARTILVFEDDVCFHRFSSARLAEAVAFLRENPGWHMFYLGCFVRKVHRTRCPAVVRVRYGSTTHAYAITREFALRLVSLKWNGTAFDDLLRSMNDEHQYALYPACAFQSDSATDNDKLLVLHRIRNLLGGMGRLQRWNEYRHYHAFGLVLAHMLVVLAAILVFLFHRPLHDLLMR